MYYAYVLRSLKDSSYYYGQTKNLETRLKIHNSGKSRYTKGHLPYVLHYSEEYDTRKQAIERERFLKSIDGYNWLRLEGIIK